MIDLHKGDCLEVMKGIESGSVDAIITDPPYGTTACKWDSVIDFELMWEQLNRIIKPNGAIVLFGNEPFSSALRMSNIKNYKYDWIWNKRLSANGVVARYQPLKITELISVFSNKKHNYFPQGVVSCNKKNYRSNSEIATTKKHTYTQLVTNFPKNILDFKGVNRLKTQHPTQKPVELMEYLIKTYTNEGETVLDFTMGSGSTGVACKQTNRNFIGIEQDDKYFEIAQNRIQTTLL